MLIFSTETPSDWNCFSSTAGGGRASAQAGGRGSAGRRYEAAAWRAACVSWWYLPNWGDSNKVHALLASSFCFDACCWRKLLLASLRFLCFLVGSRSQQNAQQALPAAPGASESEEIKMPMLLCECDQIFSAQYTIPVQYQHVSYPLPTLRSTRMTRTSEYDVF